MLAGKKKNKKNKYRWILLKLHAHSLDITTSGSNSPIPENSSINHLCLGAQGHALSKELSLATHRNSIPLSLQHLCKLSSIKAVIFGGQAPRLGELHIHRCTIIVA